MKKFSMALFAFATALALAPAAMADTLPAINGSIDISGNKDPWTLTSVTFNRLTANSFAGSGDFVTVYGDSTSIPTTLNVSSLTFSSASDVLFLTGTYDGKTFTFTIDGPVTIDTDNGTYLSFYGTGVVSMTGYHDTAVNFNFSSNDTSGKFGATSSAFALTIDANGQATPEPGSLLLLGTGILGLAGLLRRKAMLSR
jgi:hypothetical protein